MHRIGDAVCWTIGWGVSHRARVHARSMARPVVAMMVLSGLMALGCGDSPASDAGRSAQRFADAIKRGDATTFCRALSSGFTTGQPSPDERISGEVLRDCRAHGVDEYFDLRGLHDYLVNIERSTITTTRVKGRRATARLSRGGTIELTRSDGAWLAANLTLPRRGS